MMVYTRWRPERVGEEAGGDTPSPTDAGVALSAGADGTTTGALLGTVAGAERLSLTTA